MLWSDSDGMRLSTAVIDCLLLRLDGRMIQALPGPQVKEVRAHNGLSAWTFWLAMTGPCITGFADDYHLVPYHSTYTSPTARSLSCQYHDGSENTLRKEKKLATDSPPPDPPGLPAVIARCAPNAPFKKK